MEDTKEFRQKAVALLEKGQPAQAQVQATLAMTAAIEELTNVVRLLAPTAEPDPNAGKGYKEFELEDHEKLELGDVPELEIEK